MIYDTSLSLRYTAVNIFLKSSYFNTNRMNMKVLLFLLEILKQRFEFCVYVFHELSNYSCSWSYTLHVMIQPNKSEPSPENLQ